MVSLVLLFDLAFTFDVVDYFFNFLPFPYYSHPPASSFWLIPSLLYGLLFFLLGPKVGIQKHFLFLSPFLMGSFISASSNFVHIVMNPKKTSSPLDC